jgi:hypothetical protein
VRENRSLTPLRRFYYLEQQGLAPVAGPSRIAPPQRPEPRQGGR